MAFQSESGYDSDFADYCAFSFPAVVQAVGKESWPSLEAAYLTLIKDVQWKVRKSLAHSLHEIARIVGQDITEKILTQAFDLFLKDLDEVKVGVVGNVSEFMEHLGESAREKYVPVICSLPSETDNWRLRKMIAQKLGALAALVSPSTCKKNIAELGMRLLEDSVADVRQSSYKSCASILRRLWQGEVSDREVFLTYIQKLKNSTNYQVRQMFVYISQELLELENTDPSVQLFEKVFLGGLAELAEDRVPNVRLAVARVLSESMLNTTVFKSNPRVLEMKSKLAQDDVRDVVYFSTLNVPRK
jgi:serine/threonine-protein phosphatase 4 regulatory subunit 1